MSIQSKSARILAVVSLLALASACGEGAEGAEGAEQQESPAQMAPDSVKEQASFWTINCTWCQSDFWGVAPNGMSGGWMCDPGLPNTYFNIWVDKWNGSSFQQIGQGMADAYYAPVSAVCGNSPYHQFNIYVGPQGPGAYRLRATANRGGTIYGYISPTYYR